VPDRRDDAEQAVISAQVGRALRAASSPVIRCHLGLPVVVEVPPILDDGTPFPTRYWLSCPLAVRRTGRLESEGSIKTLEERARSDAEFGDRLAVAHEQYRRRRDALVPSGAAHRPTGGVGGAAAGVKCLHAHYADFAAGNPNPVGEWVASRIEPLNCVVACVVGNARNDDWVEPSR
jgi:hypothetical protein